MIRFVATLLFVLLGAGTAQARLNIVTSVPDLAALTKAVGGADVDVRSLSLSTQDPHFVDARPNLALALNKADVLIVLGGEMEVGWLPVLQRGARNSAILSGGRGYLDCSNHVALKEQATGAVDRSQGDIHPGGNPHYLRDPHNGVACAEAIAERLAKLDPEHAALFRTNLDAFKADMQKRIAGWEKAAVGWKGSPVLVYHKSWTYLIEWLGLRPIGTVEPRPGIPPSPAHVARLIAETAASKPRALLQEEYYPAGTSRLVAEKTGATLLHLPGGTRFEKQQTYPEYVDAVMSKLGEALGREEGE